jgi:hypothetical protein
LTSSSPVAEQLLSSSAGKISAPVRTESPFAIGSKCGVCSQR